MYEWLAVELGRASSLANSMGVGWFTNLRAAASDAVLEECEAILKLSLSPTHRSFLKLHDGAEFALLLTRPGFAKPVSFGVRIFGASEITASAAEFNHLFPEDAPLEARFMPVAAYGESGDLVVADYGRERQGEAIIIDGWHERLGDWPSTPAIADSFTAWLQQMLRSFTDHRKLLTYWVNETETVAFIHKPLTDI